MKILIWIGIWVGSVLLNEAMGFTIGFKLGPVLLFPLIFLVARALCKQWDEKQAREQEWAYMQDLAASGLSPFEYARNHLSETSRNFCDSHMNDPVVLEKYFDQLVCSGAIKEDDAEFLLKGYKELAQK